MPGIDAGPPPTFRCAREACRLCIQGACSERFLASITGRTAMLVGRSIGAIALISALLTSAGSAVAADPAQYPNLSGQWLAVRLGVGGQPAFDPTKPWGLGQQAPLTAEYQAVLDASVADQARGGQGNWHSGSRCLPPGMPATMTVYGEMEIVVLPETTYVLLNHNFDQHRRIFTDGRDWPQDVPPSFLGYSIGKW